MKSVDVKIREFLGQMAWGLLIMTNCRIAFYAFNSSHFPNATAHEFITGIRFDFSAIFWVLLPFIILSLVYLVVDLPVVLIKIRRWLFYAGMTLIVLFNSIDIEYFKYTLKRSTNDLFSFVATGEDIYTLVPKFLIEFWYIDILFIVLIWISIKGYQWLEKFPFKVQDKGRDMYQRVLLSIFLAAFIFIAGRGGLQLKPLGIVDAGSYTTSQNIPLVLNTPFSIIRTMGKKGIVEVAFFEPDILDKKFSPICIPDSQNQFDKKNVVIIILESFSMEFVSNDEKGKKVTPFLQELKSKSIFYPNCFANGKKSIEALPAIIAGIPTLMNEPYITSAYSTNKIDGFANYLKPFGYHTSFFHGGKNGTMNFDSFIYNAGFENYFGLDEYGNNDDYDGTWGIYDEPYLQYFCASLDKFSQPFLTSVFTLTSHHPYPIPEQHLSKFNEGETPLENTIQYTDYSLRKFFESAKKTDWFTNSIFIITADHTPNTETPKYQSQLGRYHIPLLIFEPNSDTTYTDNRITQQVDILPSVLDRLNYPNQVFSFGQSIFNDKEGYAFQYINETYQLITKNEVYQMNALGPIGLYYPNQDPMLGNNKINNSSTPKSDEFLKAVIQSYNSRVLHNKISVQ
ncbi:MAG: LTA synthase family protein [Salibacteraceae bacterium]